MDNHTIVTQIIIDPDGLRSLVKNAVVDAVGETMDALRHYLSNKMIDSHEAGEILGYSSHNTIRALMKSGDLINVNQGTSKRPRFMLADVLAYKAKKKPITHL